MASPRPSLGGVPESSLSVGCVKTAGKARQAPTCPQSSTPVDKSGFTSAEQSREGLLPRLAQLVERELRDVLQLQRSRLRVHHARLAPREAARRAHLREAQLLRARDRPQNPA